MFFLHNTISRALNIRHLITSLPNKITLNKRKHLFTLNTWHVYSLKRNPESLSHALWRDIKQALFGQTAVHSPLTPAEICSAPYPHITPNIPHHHRQWCAHGSHHQSVPTPALLINDDLHQRALGQEKGIGADVFITCMMPWCHSATLWQIGAVVQEGKKLLEGVTFKFRGAAVQGSTRHQLEMPHCRMSAGRLSITWSAPGRTSSNY